MKTFSPKPRDIERRWYLIDAQGAVLGRLASEVAKILRGKHKPIFAPHADTGDHVVVVNARGVRLTGNKAQAKVLYRHSGYPGGLRGLSYARLLSERPSLAVEQAVRGMLPKNRLGRQMIKKLAVYEGSAHPHDAQRPQALPLGQVPKWEGLPKPGAPAAAAPGARTARRRPTRRGAPAGKAGADRAGRGTTTRQRRAPSAAAGRARSAAGSARGAAKASTAGRKTSSGTRAAKGSASAGGTARTGKRPARGRASKRTKES